ncbi:hypothetical protein Scep_019655 [Stephania cephalantha]|uniref:Uncharacterized protein n=1 Tax=Stephania cephalantha TaxID=152367 RepID=A0AAP0NQ12_9MAGN
MSELAKRGDEPKRAGQWQRKGAPTREKGAATTAEEWGKAAEIWAAVETEGSGGGEKGKQRRSDSRPDGVGVRAAGRDAKGEMRWRDASNCVHERLAAAPEEKSAQRRRDPRCRGCRRALQRHERTDGVAVDDDDDSGRRRWWRGLCGGDDGFLGWFAQTRDEEEGLFGFYPFLCCDRSSLSLIVCL